MVGVPRRDPRDARRRSRPLSGAGLAHPDRVGQLADAGRADSRSADSDFPSAKWHQWDPASRDNAQGRRAARLRPRTSTRSTDSIAPTSSSSLDADFSVRPGQPALRARLRRAPAPEQAERMNRLYASRACRRSTGARADHRLPLKPSEIETVAARDSPRRRRGVDRRRRAGAASTKWIDAVAKDLQAHRGASLVIAGDRSRRVHALAHAMNAGARQCRQDGRLHRAGRGRADRSARSRSRPRRRHGGRPRRSARDRRRQPGLHRAGRSAICATR